MPDQSLPVSPSIRENKRQLIWQIVVPILLLAALIIAAAILVVSGGSNQTGVWADVSIIWMLAPLLVFGLLLIAMLAALIYGLVKLTQVTPRYSSSAQNVVASISTKTRKVADGITKPVLWSHQAGAAIKAFFHIFKYK
jgi:hypothetical protein